MIWVFVSQIEDLTQNCEFPQSTRNRAVVEVLGGEVGPKLNKNKNTYRKQRLTGSWHVCAPSFWSSRGKRH
jgi:hypothetical protein